VVAKPQGTHPGGNQTTGVGRVSASEHRGHTRLTLH
jgi:hypothetical protein